MTKLKLVNAIVWGVMSLAMFLSLFVSFGWLILVFAFISAAISAISFVEYFLTRDEEYDRSW